MTHRPSVEKDGGSAFPYLETIDGRPYFSEGMSLRDWRAGQALPAIISTVTPGIERAAAQSGMLKQGEIDALWASAIQACSISSFKFADAMLQARSPGAGE